MSNDTTAKVKTMEISKVSAGLLITVILAFGAFMFQTGIFRNELKNVKDQQMIIKTDLKEEIKNKADQKFVDLILKKMDSMDGKLDRLIESEPKENK